MSDTEDLSSEDLDAEIDSLTEVKDKIEKEHKDLIAEIDEASKEGDKIASQAKDMKDVRKQRA